MAMEDAPSQTKKKRVGRRRRNLAICTAYCHFDIVREIAKSMGMREVVEAGQWNIFWTDMSVSIERAKNMKGFQRINHFPGMAEICRKDLLARNLMRMKKLFPEEYNFFPKTWILPADYGSLTNNCTKRKSKIFILKPFLSSQGRGIFLSVGLKNIPFYERMICQRYITKPFLIDGFKFDLRVYTLVTSCDPLRVFVYNEGLVRFATKKYSKPSLHNISNVYMHLTNYAVNKFSRTYIKDGECGSKRKISTLNTWLSGQGFDVAALWENIDEVIMKTLLCAYQTLKHSYSACFSSHSLHQACFELLGFDIILDHKLRPFLLEVNHSPSFGTKSVIDDEVKRNLILDTFTILNVNKLDKNKVLREDKQRCKDRLLQGTNCRDDKIQLLRHIDMSKKQERLKEQEKWEQEHMGNFRMIYPLENSSKYDDFTKEETSIIQATIATRTREEAVRQSRTELEEKASFEAGKMISQKLKGRGESKQVPSKNSPTPEKLPSMQNIKSSYQTTAKVRRQKPEDTQCDDGRSHKVHPERNYVRNSFEPHPMETELEKHARLAMQRRRDLVAEKTGLAKKKTPEVLEVTQNLQS